MRAAVMDEVAGDRADVKERFVSFLYRNGQPEQSNRLTIGGSEDFKTMIGECDQS